LSGPVVLLLGPPPPSLPSLHSTPMAGSQFARSKPNRWLHKLMADTCPRYIVSIQSVFVCGRKGPELLTCGCYSRLMMSVQVALAVPASRIRLLPGWPARENEIYIASWYTLIALLRCSATDLQDSSRIREGHWEGVPVNCPRALFSRSSLWRF